MIAVPLPSNLARWSGGPWNMRAAPLLEGSESENRPRRNPPTEALASMRNAAEIYRQSNNTHWLPIAERRVKAMHATLAKMVP